MDPDEMKPDELKLWCEELHALALGADMSAYSAHLGRPRLDDMFRLNRTVEARAAAPSRPEG